MSCGFTHNQKLPNSAGGTSWRPAGSPFSFPHQFLAAGRIEKNATCSSDPLTSCPSALKSLLIVLVLAATSFAVKCPKSEMDYNLGVVAGSFHCFDLGSLEASGFPRKSGLHIGPSVPSTGESPMTMRHLSRVQAD